MLTNNDYCQQFYFKKNYWQLLLIMLGKKYISNALDFTLLVILYMKFYNKQYKCMFIQTRIWNIAFKFQFTFTLLAVLMGANTGSASSNSAIM